MIANAEQMKFLEIQYTTLRKEIETSKANMFKLVVGGAAVIPTAQSLASTYSIGIITLALPLIVVVLVLLFLTENHSMMRAGTYNRQGRMMASSSVSAVAARMPWMRSSTRYARRALC